MEHSCRELDEAVPPGGASQASQHSGGEKGAVEIEGSAPSTQLIAPTFSVGTFSFQELLRGVSSGLVPQFLSPYGVSPPIIFEEAPLPASSNNFCCPEVLDTCDSANNDSAEEENVEEDDGAAFFCEPSCSEEGNDESLVHSSSEEKSTEEHDGDGAAMRNLGQSSSSFELGCECNADAIDKIKRMHPGLTPEAIVQLKKCAVGECGCVLRQEIHQLETQTEYKKRTTYPKGVTLPDCRPARAMGAVEIAMRLSPSRKTKYIFQPHLGITFDSIAEAWEFCNLYSLEVGHGIAKGSKNDRNKSKYQTMQEFRCECGRTDSRYVNTKKTGCKWLVRLLRTSDHGWYISFFRGEHNHPLSDVYGEKLHWRSHGYIDQYTKDMVRYLRENNVSLTKVHCILGSMFGSLESLPFTKRSLRTICQQIANDQIKDDIKKTLGLFRNMRADDPEFQFSVLPDEDNRITALIWTNGRCRNQYLYYGDVVTFDTTYCTNIYKMPFGMFVGVNNHFQSVIFAGVLMLQETTDAFKWVFKEFQSLMGGKAPQTVLTDQCQAMTSAVGEVWPDTTHLWCKWHIFRKVRQGLGSLYSNNTEFRDDFHYVVNEMLTVDEFERGWEDLIERYELRDNPFMITAYQKREKWAKPFNAGKFCARMTSTQRSESANNMLKIYCPRNSSMNMFVAHYNKLLVDRIKEEDRATFETKQVNHYPKRMWMVEKHAMEIYTRAAYNLFKEEVDRSTDYDVWPMEGECNFEVIHVNADKRKRWSRVKFIVNVHNSGQTFKCECGLYEHFGILCRHSLRVMDRLRIHRIPDNHIMKRWTRKARDILPDHLKMYQQDSSSLRSMTFRHSDLRTKAYSVVQKGNHDLDTYFIVTKHLMAAEKELDEAIKAKTDAARQEVDVQCYFSCAEGDDENGQYTSSSDREGRNTFGASGSSAGMSDSELLSLKAPSVKRKRGKARLNRYPSAMDLPKKKPKKNKTGRVPGITISRFCKTCGSDKHNTARCSKNPNAGKKKQVDSKCTVCGLVGHKSKDCISERLDEDNW